MKIYLMYFLILVITIIFFTIVKDKLKALRITGIITISSGLLLITLSWIAKVVISISITSINLSLITNYLFRKFLSTSLILLSIGLFEILLSKYIYSRRKLKL